jgi:hypothetical protein
MAQTAGKTLLDVRARYEFADQEGRAESAGATTLRVRAGYETGAWNNFRLLGEVEGVVRVGGDFNDTLNGRTAFPVVADPDALEINRLQAVFTGVPGTTVTAGRQRIILDNARFVGNVGFRQNEQTFDAVRVQTDALGPLHLDYAFVGRVQRIFGPDSVQNDFNGDSHLVNVSAATRVGRLTGYGYWLDLEEAQRLSSATVGVRLARATPSTPAWSVDYAVEYARQKEHGDAVRPYDAEYAQTEIAVKHGSASLAVGGELLTGDGVNAFQTPLGTLHAFQGAADQFLVTPADGLRDIYLRGGYQAGAIGPFASARLGFEVHEFTDDTGGTDLGREIDVVLRGTLSARWAIDLKAARFEGSPAGPDDLTRVWAAVEFKL